MMNYRAAIGVAFALLVSLSFAFAQKSTERFIPIGQSPGLSGKHTKIANIDSFDPQRQTLMLSDPSGTYSVEMAQDTQIWLDKSKTGSTNDVGVVSDLEAGRRIEVKYKENDPEAPAEWIKVETVE
jgi:hypothetical protein